MQQAPNKDKHPPWQGGVDGDCEFPRLLPSQYMSPFIPRSCRLNFHRLRQFQSVLLKYTHAADVALKRPRTDIDLMSIQVGYLIIHRFITALLRTLSPRRGG